MLFVLRFASSGEGVTLLFDVLPCCPSPPFKGCAFCIPSHTTFPTKMVPLRNSPSSLSQHDLLVCARVFKNAMSVFNYVTLLSLSVGTFRSFSQSV